MRLAMTCAQQVKGRTGINPPVGAVVIDAAGVVCGTGGTDVPGGPHAEVSALAVAGNRAQGATVVVTLEPCAHTGRTGPCTQALIDAGVRRVVYALDDPNPIAAGGASVLRKAGVDVVAGVLADDVAAGAIRAWLHSLRVGRPLVTWKLASTLDGRVAAADGSARWISGPESRADAHRLRAQVDAILVGSGTVMIDDPSLTVRGEDGDPVGRQPLRVVIDRRHRVPLTASVHTAPGEVLVLDTAVPVFALKALYDRGVRHVLLEGGPTLAGAFVEAGCVDEVVAYIAPKLLGAGPTALGDAGMSTITDALQLHIVDVAMMGNDVRVVAVPVRDEGSS